MLTTVKIINYLFSMNNYFVKVPESYKKSYKFAYEVLWIFTLFHKKWKIDFKFRHCSNILYQWFLTFFWNQSYKTILVFKKSKFKVNWSITTTANSRLIYTFLRLHFFYRIGSCSRTPKEEIENLRFPL